MLLKKQIIDFHNSLEYKELADYYNRPSLITVWGGSRRENNHSDFLAWLFRSNETHGLSDLPLCKFLETIAYAEQLIINKGKISGELSSIIISGDYTLFSVQVEREKFVDNGRLDIYISCNLHSAGRVYPLCLIIENKVKSSETDSQTMRYYKWAKDAISREVTKLHIYLSPLPSRDMENLKAVQCKCAAFIQINYQYIADYVIAPCLNHIKIPIVKTYFDDYLRALSIPELEQDRGDIIMAVGTEERELLNKFWNKHKKLLIAAITALQDNTELNDNEREILKQASDVAISVDTRDTSRYSYTISGKGKTNLGKRKLVLEIVTDYVKTHPNLTLAQLKTAFPDNILGKAFGVVSEITAARDKDLKHPRYNFDDNNILHLADCTAVVCNQWRIDNMKAFTDQAKNLGYSISVVK